MIRDPASRLCCPFGVDFEVQACLGAVGHNRRIAVHSLPWWLALVELHADGYRYGTDASKELPYVFDLVAAASVQRRQAREADPGGAAEHSFVVAEDLAQALIANPVFRYKIGTFEILKYALRPEEARLAEVPDELLLRGEMTASGSLMPLAAAETIATGFFDFAIANGLADSIARMSSEQIQLLALYHAHLARRPPKRLVISERLDFVLKKKEYVPAVDVPSPETPHFAHVASLATGASASDGAPEHSRSSLAVMQAPVVCQLCGAGFLSPKQLWRHAEKAHHSWAECRKRLIYEIQQRHSVPLAPREKRRLAANFYQDLLFSNPSRDTLRPGECTMRQIVACATCAIKDWIDDFYPCYLWKEAPEQNAGAAEHAENEDDGDEARDSEVAAPSRTKGPLLRDSDNFCYFGQAEKIHRLLQTEKYIPFVPMAADVHVILEELHASSVQHPRFPHMRWLLNTQRVPVLNPEAASDLCRAVGAAEHHGNSAQDIPDTRPSCAGIGDPDQAAWLCHHCASHLCCPEPRMPPQALANGNWGGRELPEYQNLSMAMRSILSLAKLCARMVDITYPMFLSWEKRKDPKGDMDPSILNLNDFT